MSSLLLAFDSYLLNYTPDILKFKYLFRIHVDVICNIGDSGLTVECQEAHRRSLDDPEGFWAEVADQLVWTKKWDRVLDNSNPPFTKW